MYRYFLKEVSHHVRIFYVMQWSRQNVVFFRISCQLRPTFKILLFLLVHSEAIQSGSQLDYNCTFTVSRLCTWNILKVFL